MSGTISGGKKAAQKNKELHGKDFYRNIGRKGGKRSTTGGFASQKVGKDGLTGLERASIAGAKGGRKSKRPSATIQRLKDRIRKDSRLYEAIRDIYDE